MVSVKRSPRGCINTPRAGRSITSRQVGGGGRVCISTFCRSLLEFSARSPTRMKTIVFVFILVFVGARYKHVRVQ